MALNCVVTKRTFGFDPNKEEKYVVRPVSSGEVSFERLCTQVCQICGAHRGVVQQVIAGLVDAMINDLDDGKSVRLGEFGLFRPTIHSKAVDDEKDATAQSVKRKRVHFTPGKAFKGAMENLSVTRYSIPETDWTGGDDTDENGYINL